MNFTIWQGGLHFDFEWNYLSLADLLFFKSFLIFYNLVMLLRSSISKEDSGPFRIIGQFRVCQNQPYPCEFNSFSVLVRKQARARHVCYDDLMINRSLWILVSLNVFPLQRSELLSWMCSIIVVTITVRATRVIPKSTWAIVIIRGTQRPFSVKYLFREANIAYKNLLFWLEDGYKFLDDRFIV